MDKYFGLSYDCIGSARMAQQLRAFVSENKHIDSWSKPYDGLILMRSRQDYETLFHSFAAFFGDGFQYVVFEISAATTIGLFTDVIWEWFGRIDVPELPKLDL